MKTSVMLESYCADIERLVRDGTLRPAVRASLALPDVCAALEDAQMQSSRERYESWCAAWLTWQPTSNASRGSGHRLYRVYTRPAALIRRHLPGAAGDVTEASLGRLRMSRRLRRERPLSRARVWQPASRLEAFQVGLIEALVEASRRWYSERGADHALVQRNLGRLLVSA